MAIPMAMAEHNLTVDRRNCLPAPYINGAVSSTRRVQMPRPTVRLSLVLSSSLAVVSDRYARSSLVSTQMSRQLACQPSSHARTNEPQLEHIIVHVGALRSHTGSSQPKRQVGNSPHVSTAPFPQIERRRDWGGPGYMYQQ